jgi:CheY-like chemotaxis protein
LSSVIAAAIDTLRPAIDAKDIRLETRLEPDAEAIRGDADRLQQIVWNLLSNAVKFTPEGGTVEISLSYGTDYAQIVVKDNGSGIEPEFLPFVFDRFRQADGKMNRRHGGLGLGLAIVRHLAELHGGSVFVSSKGAEQGSAFTLRFPLRSSRAKAEENSAEETGKNGAAAAFSDAAPRRKLAGLKILVVDDEPDALDLTAFILSDQSAEVLTARSVDEALEILEKEKLDALVSDIGMPEKDGLELIREIKARTNREYSPLPSIALTAYAREEDSRQALQAGFDAYLPKPVEPAKLIEELIEITNNYH